MKNPSLAQNLALNPEESGLECKDFNGIKSCIVSWIHFTNKESGYYYTHHSNHLGNPSIYYESNPINVILPPLDKRIEIRIEDEYNQNEVFKY